MIEKKAVVGDAALRVHAVGGDLAHRFRFQYRAAFGEPARAVAAMQKKPAGDERRRLAHQMRVGMTRHREVRFHEQQVLRQRLSHT